MREKYDRLIVSNLLLFVAAAKNNGGIKRARSAVEKPHWNVFSKACEAFKSKVEEPDAAFYFGRFVGQKLKAMTEDRKMRCMMDIINILSGSITNEVESSTKMALSASITSQPPVVMPSVDINPLAASSHDAKHRHQVLTPFAASSRDAKQQHQVLNPL